MFKTLIIDDSEQDQKIMERYLRKAGYQDILVAGSGEAGVDVAQLEAPDIILVDTLLPGIDGFETCRIIKKDKQLAATVIMMTGRVDAVDVDKARQSGADDYCVKTSDCAPLLEALQKRGGNDKPALVVAPAPPKVSLPEAAYPEWGLEKTNQAIKALYRELEKKNEELGVLDRLKSEFVSTVSHELRTPLTIIKGALSQILEGLYGGVTPQQKEKIEMALRGTNLLHRIIDDLLDISKLEAKKITLNKIPVDLFALAQEIRQGFLPLAQQKGLQINLRCAQPQLLVQADRDRICQVFTNLIGNALKFTSQGKIDICLEDRENHVEGSVIDTGRGIAEDDQAKVFDRFQQFGKSFEPGQEGTGLGLSICKDIIELHQGEIFVVSKLDVGSKFMFTLPKTSLPKEA